jgi:hypothetical protein
MEQNPNKISHARLLTNDLSILGGDDVSGIIVWRIASMSSKETLIPFYKDDNQLSHLSHLTLLQLMLHLHLRLLGFQLSNMTYKFKILGSRC